MSRKLKLSGARSMPRAAMGQVADRAAADRRDEKVQELVEAVVGISSTEYDGPCWCSALTRHDYPGLHRPYCLRVRATIAAVRELDKE